MSFNIRYGTAADGVDAWPNRRAHAIALMRREAPDILGLQEALRFQLDEIGAALDGYAVEGVGRDDGRDAGEFAAILWRRDRFTRLAGGTFWFSDTPGVPGSTSWGNRITRICTWLHLRDRVGGRGVWIYNVHLDHESQPSRERSVALLIERIAARGDRDPVIVTGDFNAGEDNPAVAAMVAAGFRDSWRAGHPLDPVAGTFNGFRGDSAGPKIDYVFVQTVSRVLDAAILRDHDGGRFPSDHFPVTATLRPHEGLRIPAPLPRPADGVEGGELAALTVTATRVERRVADQALRVEVVEPEEIAEKLAMTPGDVAMLLNETGGLRVTTTAPSMGAAGVRVHGLAGRYTLMLADGLPLYGPAGGLGLLQIPPMDLRQVEIVKGTSSALYGNGGLGGLVNFVSRRPLRAREVLANATTLGGADLVGFAADGDGQRGWTLLAGVHRQARTDRDGDGWTDVAGYERAVLRPRLFLDNGRGRRGFLTAGMTVESREGGTLPGDTAPDGLPFAEALETRRGDVGFAGQTLTVSGLLIAARASAMLRTQEPVFGPARDRQRHATGFAEASLTRPGRVTWVAGLAVRGERFRSDATPWFDFTHTASAGFVEADATPHERVVLNAGVRLEHHSTAAWQVHPRGSVLLRVGGSWTARLSGGSGYFAATPFTEQTEEVGLWRLRAAALRDERARTVSLDVGGLLGPVEMNATVFATRVEHPIVSGATSDLGGGGPGPDSVVLRNAQQPARTAGLDLVARWARDPWHVVASWTYLWTRERDILDRPRSPAPLNPSHAAGLVAMHEEAPWRLGAEVYVTGPQELEDNAFRARSPTHVILGFLVQRDLGRARVFLNLENLGDVRITRFDPLVNPVYRAVTGWTSTPWGPLEGRVINGGVRLSL